MSVRCPVRSVMVTTLFGPLRVEAAQHYESLLQENASTRPVIGLHDWSQITNYEWRALRRLALALHKHRERLEVQHVYVASAPLALALVGFDHASGGDTLRVHRKRDSFRAALARAIAVRERRS